MDIIKSVMFVWNFSHSQDHLSQSFLKTVNLWKKTFKWYKKNNQQQQTNNQKLLKSFRKKTKIFQTIVRFICKLKWIYTWIYRWSIHLRTGSERNCKRNMFHYSSIENSFDSVGLFTWIFNGVIRIGI